MLLNRERAYEIMDRHKLDGLVALRPHNVTYLTGYERRLGFALGSTVIAVLARRADLPIVLLIPQVELTTAAVHSLWAQDIRTMGEFVVHVPEGARLIPEEERLRDLWRNSYSNPGHKPLVALEKILTDLGIARGRLAFDEPGIGFLLRENGSPGLMPIPGEDVLREIRMIKTPPEIERLAQVTQVNEAAGLEMYELCRPGVMWRDVVRQYNVALARQGAIPQFFSSNAGPASSMIFPLDDSERVIQVSDIIRHDYGCTYRSYWSDTGRTIVAGAPSDQLLRYYEACRRGLEAVEANLKPGVAMRDLFTLAVETVHREGIPHYARSHCGHGIGLEMYEAGRIAPSSELVLEPGMVLNVEVPYYELGWGGLQVEDTFLITKSDPERLTHMARDLILH
jgi:Xaa-Pro aminopeptidase